MMIVLIDPDYCSRAVMRYHLRHAGYTVIDGHSGAVLDNWSSTPPDLLIVDESAQLSDGQPILDALSAGWSTLPILLLLHVPRGDLPPTITVLKPVLRDTLLRYVDLLIAEPSRLAHPAA